MPLCFTGSGAIRDNEKKSLTDDTVSMRDNVLRRLTSLRDQSIVKFVTATGLGKAWSSNG